MSPTDQRYDEAIALQQSGDVEGAIQKLKELVGEEPNYALAHAALSVFYSRQDKFDEAIEHGRKVCELEPEDPFSFVALSLVCQKAGRISEAEQALWQARQSQAAARFGDAQ